MLYSWRYYCGYADKILEESNGNLHISKVWYLYPIFQGPIISAGKAKSHPYPPSCTHKTTAVFFLSAYEIKFWCVFSAVCCIQRNKSNNFYNWRNSKDCNCNSTLKVVPIFWGTRANYDIERMVNYFVFNWKCSVLKRMIVFLRHDSKMEPLFGEKMKTSKQCHYDQIFALWFFGFII